MDSAQPTSNFKIKIAIDTQILAYLIDKSYPQLNLFFKCLNDCPFVDITCSRFATYEFLEIRKQEHYLRKIHSKANASGSIMNFSSVLRYKRSWSATELPYDVVFEDVKLLVEDELIKANDDFGIDYGIGLHDDLWGIQQDLVLSSKISKEDSLVLLSSVLPGMGEIERYLLFLTNDDQFYEAYAGKSKMPSVDKVFEEHKVNMPFASKIASISTPLSLNEINLIKDTKTKEEVEAFVRKFLFEHIQIKNKKSLLGKTKPCSASTEGKLLCFELVKESLENNLYVTILSPNLDLLYHHPVELKDFYNVNQIKDYSYIPNESNETSRNISVNLVGADGNYLDKSEWEKLTKTGNLIFIHPDSEV